MPGPARAAVSIEAEVVIVGAGPVGLFEVFELGLLGIRAHVVESLPQVGGQCATLYPEKPIYDIPALPVVGAQELVDRLMEQIAPFEPVFHLGEEVTELARADYGRLRVATGAGTELLARAVVVAGGLGSFQPRPLRLAGAERHVGVNLEYRVRARERYRGRRVVILGGGDSALDWALDLFEVAASVTLVHRREGFRAAPASVERMRALAERHPERMRFVVARIAGLVEADGRLAGLEIEPVDGAPETLALDELLVFYGLSPNLGPIANWGLDGDRRHVRVDPATFETSEPGVFAIGDVNVYPGKKKLILCGFHEAALAAYAIQHHLDPQAKQRVLYTTTSSVLQERLGVAGDIQDR